MLYPCTLLTHPAPTPNYTESEIASSPSEDSCMEICGLHNIQSGLSERDALCSDSGLKNTLECALCIDNTWDETTYEDSAMAEYERIVEACHQTEQKVLRSQDM